MSSFDKTAYRTLKKIIIEYNENLKPGFKRYLSAFNDDERTKEQAANIYFNYLKSNDYFSTAQLIEFNDSSNMGYVQMLKILLK